MFGRFERLTRYAVDYGADGILYTCSAFGPAIERSASTVSIPVLKPNEAMFEAALAAGKRIGMVATFAPAIKSMEAEFKEAAHGSEATLRTVLADGAIEALRAGDEATHNRLVAAAADTLSDTDAILLAHFSTSRALSEVAVRVKAPVFTAPDAAVAKLRSLVIA
jgi:Asp/Glu/hydantoin racemase